jgi:hypothetical protein
VLPDRLLRNVVLLGTSLFISSFAQSVANVDTVPILSGDFRVSVTWGSELLAIILN